MSGADTWKKLTEPQRLLLWSLAEHLSVIASNYAPRKKLEALGLIERKGNANAPTPAGWCALQPVFWKVPAGWTFRAHKEGEKRVVEVSRPALPKAHHEVSADRFQDACDALKALLVKEGIIT